MKLISVNIEWNKHLNTVLPFIKSEKPDVLCLQEVALSNLHQFDELGYTSTFLPFTIDRFEDSSGEFGIALLARKETTRVLSTETYFYHHQDGRVVPYDKTRVEETINRGVIMSEIMYHNQSFTILTTHFPDGPNGSLPTQMQRDDLTRLLTYIKTKPPHIFCGDFNLPRNENPLYDTLVADYSNAIPNTYHSSLDRTFHRAKDKPEAQILFTHYMVDHLLMQAPYTANNVRLQFGVSDHAAIVATIEKT